MIYHSYTIKGYEPDTDGFKENPAVYLYVKKDGRLNELVSKEMTRYEFYKSLMTILLDFHKIGDGESNHLNRIPVDSGGDVFSVFYPHSLSEMFVEYYPEQKSIIIKHTSENSYVSFLINEGVERHFLDDLRHVVFPKPAETIQKMKILSILGTPL